MTTALPDAAAPSAAATEVAQEAPFAVRESDRATAIGGPGRALGASIELADLGYPATRLRKSCIDARQV